MSSQRSGSVSDFGDFVQFSANDLESQRGSPEREDSPVLVDAREIIDEGPEATSENQRLREVIARLEDRIIAQDNRILDMTIEMNNEKDGRVQERTANGTLISKLLGELETLKTRQLEVEREKNQMERVRLENQQLKEAMDRMEKLSIEEKVKVEVKQEPNEQLLEEVRSKDQQIVLLRNIISGMEAQQQKKAQERKERRARRMMPYPLTKTPLQMQEELMVVDQQIGIIVDHNHYLRTIEANEHSQEVARLRQENEQLNATIVYLKQQLV
uniref:SCHIP-1 domain-containing protein n=1 Tax=Caenorhabditis tropicalis TaxID=1561998 RepID=A0A1I7TPL4_9PELO